MTAMDTYNIENTLIFGDELVMNEDRFFFSDLDEILTSPTSYDEQLQGTLKYIDAFESTDVTTWSREDCFRWAQQVCQEQGVDPCSVNLEFFSSVTGCDLAQYSRFDFHSQFDSIWGSLFYDQFHHLLEHIGFATSTPTSDYESSSSTFSDCSSSDASSFSSSSNSPFYENDEELADLCELPPLTIPEDFAELDQFLHQQVPQEQELEVKPQVQAGWGRAWEDYQGDLFAPPEVTFVKAEPEVMKFEESYREISPSPSPESVVPSCRALDKIRTKSRKRERGPKNWEFVIRLLADKQYNPDVVRWEDKTCYTFRFVRPAVIAQMWGQRSNKPNLSYDNFARGLRYHYTTGALSPVSERQLVYKCGPKARKFLEDLQQGTW